MKEYLTSEAERAYRKKYYREHREEILEKSKKYREAHKEESAVYGKRYRMTHDLSEYYHQYYLRNKERYRQRNLERRERMKMEVASNESSAC